MGRRFGEQLKQQVYLTTSCKEGENQEEEAREKDPSPEVSDNDTDYNDEQYDGVSYPKLHLRSYVRKIQPHTVDRNLWVHFFQDNLSGTQLEWFYQLEGTNVRN